MEKVTYTPVQPENVPLVPTAPTMGVVTYQPAPVPEMAPPTYYEAFQGLNPVGAKPNEPFIPRYNVVPVHLSREKTYLVCPYCFKQMQTTTDYEYAWDTHLHAICLGVIGWPCALYMIPYCCEKPEIVHHYCAECKQYLGMAYEDNPLLQDRIEEIRREEGH